MNDITLYSQPAFSAWELARMWIDTVLGVMRLWLVVACPILTALRRHVRGEQL